MSPLKSNDDVQRNKSPKASSKPSAILNPGEEDEMEVAGYTFSLAKTIITWTLIILSVGLLRLIFHWWSHLMLYTTHSKCSLAKAQKVLVIERYGKGNYKRYHVKEVKTLTSPTEFNTVKGDKVRDSLRLLSIPTPEGGFSHVKSLRYFFCKKLRYIWNEDCGNFIKLQGLERVNAHLLHENKGLSPLEQVNRLVIFGPNEIKVKVASIPRLLFLEVLNPFYVFQVFSVILWYIDYYYYYASAIVLMSVFGIASTVYQTRQNQNRLKSTVQSSDIATVSRGQDTFETIRTEYLVPGDVIVIPAHGCVMHCDAVLLSGNCIVNESMLTGESVPVTKTPLPDTPDLQYDIKEHSRHTLFCGTRILQTRYYGQEKVFAVVIRSGFLTAKGQLVRSIMYPPPVDYKFETDSYKFVGFLASIAAIGFGASIWWKIEYGETVRAIIIQSLDLITIVIPPALPAAMTVGRIYALKRLREKGIYCISPRAVTVTGSIDCVCFDKTGTLTEEGLDLWGVIPVSDGVFEDQIVHVGDVVRKGNFEAGMATCHSLTLIDGELVGDPLDLKMFEWTKWSLEEPEVADSEKFDCIIPAIVRSPNDKDKEEIGIVRQFPFSSSLQRMSVIVRSLGETDFDLYVKGSPEVISSLSCAATIPDDFISKLTSYTQLGYRVIALGHKRLSMNYTKAQRILREEVEQDLNFLGLIVLDNRLKPESAREIAILKNAGIRTVMVTGDNIQTSMSVAIECKMIDPSEKVYIVEAESEGSGSNKPLLSFTKLNTKSQIEKLTLEETPPSKATRDIEMELSNRKYHLAISGKTFTTIKTFYPELLDRILVRGAVFARMSPDQKQQLVEHLQGLGYFVGMCGDGANDCGALKAAHAGVSLSEAEASVASPFTYNQNNISCIPNLIREGRTTLTTSFGIFKYMAIYSFTQFISVCILYTVSANLSDPQFLYIDLFIISIFALFFGYTEPHPGPLVNKPPPTSLVSLPPIISISLHMILTFAFQVVPFVLIKKQPWFQDFIPDEEDEMQVESYENYAVFTASIFQYIFMAVVFSQGRPYRKAIWTNYRLISSILLMSVFTLYLVVEPFEWLRGVFQLRLPPIEFQLVLGGVIVANMVLAFIVEEFVVNFLIVKRGVSWGKGTVLEYERIDREMGLDRWPVVYGNPT